MGLAGKPTSLLRVYSSRETLKSEHGFLSNVYYYHEDENSSLWDSGRYLKTDSFNERRERKVDDVYFYFRYFNFSSLNRLNSD